MADIRKLARDVKGSVSFIIFFLLSTTPHRVRVQSRLGSGTGNR